jgi:hypothetical protein
VLRYLQVSPDRHTAVAIGCNSETSFDRVFDALVSDWF